ncbi:hypothetical protein JHK87_050671 [Glycine soja]|nr:hypothetical protein JHK87_050671 [Glycine soja]
MAWRCGSLSRSVLSAARFIPTCSSISRLHRSSLPSLRSHLLHSRYPLNTLPREVCMHSLMPLHNVDTSARLTSHISVESCACCELSQGTQIPISYTQCGMLSIIIMMCFHCSIYLFKCFCVFNRYLNRL